MIFLNQLLSNKSESNTVIQAKIKKQIVFSSEEKASTLPYNVCNGCAVVYQNEIHLMGSEESTLTSKNHYKWDGTTWIRISTLPFELKYGASVVYNDEIHLFGYPSYHYKWDGSAWTSVGVLPCMILENYSAIVHNNEIHLISRDAGNKHYKFDGITWTEVSTPPMTLSAFRMVSYKNKIHVLGSGSGHNEHYSWDGSTWEKIGDLPYYFWNGVVIVYNNEIHIIGTSNSYHWCDHYKWVDDTTWTLIYTVWLMVYNDVSVVYNGRINILGGSPSNSTFTRHSMLAGVSIENCISIYSKNSNVYSTNFTESGDYFTIPIDEIGSGAHIFVYNKDNTKLLYTNQTLMYNEDTSKYEMYGYFPDTLKGTSVPITSSGWQTLQLDTPKLFN